MEQLWRSGALAGLVVTLCKRAASAGLSQALEFIQLLHLLLPSRPGQQVWYGAGGSEDWRSQLALFLLARAGGAVAAAALPYLLPDAASSEVDTAAQASLCGEAKAVPVLSAAAAQLVREPSLRQLLEAAAPALLPAADEMHAAWAVCEAAWSSGAGGRDGSDLQRGSLELLVALGRQLDPLALGLDLPGCWNPSCTSLAGASEVDMKLKKCTACKIARWVASARPGSARGTHQINGPRPCLEERATTPHALLCAVPLHDHVTLGRSAPPGTAILSAPRRTGNSTRPPASGRWRRRRPGATREGGQIPSSSSGPASAPQTRTAPIVTL
jgi:hypothetical protein